MIDRDNLFIWFMKNEKELYESMLNTSHNISTEEYNIYHAEGSIISHTLLVMSYFEYKKEKYNFDDYITLLTSALLHDTGKPECIEIFEANKTKPRRYSFKNHEGVSSFISIGILKKLQKYFPEIYTEEIIKNIIKVVSLHGTFIEETSDIYLLRMEFHKADKSGAVRDRKEKLFSQYEPRKFLKQTKKEDKELIILAGLPCSGKSTYRNEYLKNNPDTFVVSRDDFLEVFFIKEMNEKLSYNNMYFTVHHDEEQLKKFNREFEELITEASKKDKVLIDMTMLSLSSRRKMLSKFNKHKATCKMIFTDNETLNNRNLKRFAETGKKINNSVIDNMKKSFTLPVKEEGFESVEIIIN